MARCSRGLQISLVEALALILIAGVGAAALRTGGVLAALLLQGAIWFTAASAVAAVFARGDWRAFAVGWLVGVAFYVAPVWYAGESEFDPYVTRLPLTQPALSVWRAMDMEAFVHEPTGERFSVWTTTATQSYDRTDSLVNPFQAGPLTLADGRPVTHVETVPRAEFMLILHAFLALASGYAFGKFAAIVYRRSHLATASSAAGGASDEPTAGDL